MSIFNGFKNWLQKEMVLYLQNSNYDSKWSVETSNRKYISEGYKMSVWVYACVNEIAYSIAGIQWRLYRQKANGEKVEIEEHPILNMCNGTANEAMGLTGADMFALWAIYLATQGQAFFKLNNAIVPSELEPLYPFQTSPIPDKKEFIKGYKYQVQGAEVSTIFDKSEIMWSRFYDPENIYEGLSPIKALARTIDTENDAVKWNKSQFENKGMPQGLISVEGGLTEESKRQFGDRWKKEYQGADKKRVPMILNATNAKWTPISMSQSDMDFIEQRKTNRVEICGAFGVPTQAVGIPDAQQYSNYEEAMKSFWENTLIPNYLNVMRDALNTNICAKYSTDLKLDYDISEIQYLKESTELTHKMALERWTSDVYTLNETRKMLGDDEAENGDMHYSDILGKGLDDIVDE